MGRARCRFTFQDAAGNKLAGASVNVYEGGTTSPVAATLFSGFTGADTLANPLTTDSNGAILFYMASPQMVDLKATLANFSDITISRVHVEPDPTVPAVRAWHNANQSIATATATTLAFNSEAFDTDTMHDTATNNSRITFTTAGTYLIVTQIRFEANTTGRRTITFRKNGTTNYPGADIQAGATATNTILTATLMDVFAAADYIEVRVTQDSGGALNVETGGSNEPSVQAVRVG